MRAIYDKLNEWVIVEKRTDWEKLHREIDDLIRPDGSVRLLLLQEMLLQRNLRLLHFYIEILRGGGHFYEDENEVTGPMLLLLLQHAIVILDEEEPFANLRSMWFIMELLDIVGHQVIFEESSPAIPALYFRLAIKLIDLDLAGAARTEGSKDHCRQCFYFLDFRMHWYKGNSPEEWRLFVDRLKRCMPGSDSFVYLGDNLELDTDD